MGVRREGKGLHEIVDGYEGPHSAQPLGWRWFLQDVLHVLDQPVHLHVHCQHLVTGRAMMSSQTTTRIQA